MQEKRLIFTVTTGRSGTALLAELLSGLPGVQSVHEAEPDFADAMRAAQSDPSAARVFLEMHKLPAIANEPTPVHIETSHLFCKGFLHPLLELGITPDLILLSRPHREVAKSLWQLGTIPARTDNGRRFLLQPSDPVLLPMPQWQEMTDYELCYWYCLEIEKRQQVYADTIHQRGGRTVAITLREFQGLKGIQRLLAELALPTLPLGAKARLALRKPPKVNEKAGRKAPWDLEAEVENMERRVRQRAGLPEDHLS
jgi:hypothetical protein